MAESERTPIVVFFHVCMINHWKDLVKYELDLIVSSGLYDEIKKIYIGCVGEQFELDNLKNIIIEYPNVSIKSYDPCIDKYEFVTLRLIEKECKKKDQFIGLYIHTKGVSYPGNVGGKCWLDYMNYYNITKWGDAIEHIEKGYDCYGVKLISGRDVPAFKMHYSGNFFWFHSEYARTLKKIDKLCQSNRGEAEMWICSNSPIAATASQLFIDYDSNFIFEP
jgi:hypothetical protein